jgi:plasmid stabilization system protein ParE
VRLSERAQRDIDAAVVRLAEISGSAMADAWQDGLLLALGGLTVFPERCSFVPEQAQFTRPVRHLLYRRPGSGRRSPAYRAFFELLDAQGTQDAPTVYVLHVRHGAAAPVSAEEAHEIETQADEAA